MRAPTIMLFLVCSATLPTQLSSQSRAQEIAASFTKSKHVVKLKHGVRAEKYKDVRSEPTIRRNLKDYSGVYEAADLGCVLNVQVAPDGSVQASGTEGGEESRTFELEDARIANAVLTGRKVYRDGTVEQLEGAFLTRTDRDSPTDPGTVAHGIGVVLATPVEFGGNSFDKLFYRLKQ